MKPELREMARASGHLPFLDRENMGDNRPAADPIRSIRTKVLHVEIPEPTYWHIRKCAIESQMSIKDFVTELGRTASPFQLQIMDSDVRVKDEPNAPGRTTRRAA